MFIAPIKTIIISNEWICENTPCRVIYMGKTFICVRPFNKTGNYNIDETLYHNFIRLQYDKTYVYTKYYPNKKIKIDEFFVKKINKNIITKHFKHNKNIIKIIDKIFQDAYTSKGNTCCITINNYNKYIKNPIQTKLQRIGDPIFNRAQRNTPPIIKEYTRNNFEKNISFPAPIGIRYEDFAYPSEQNKIVKELLQQFFNSENAPECPVEIINLLNLEITPNSHKCGWCGILLNFSEIDQSYCSIEHSINFCHRDPNIGTKYNNIYLGCGKCNREQGGFSEKERIEQIARLVNSNKKHLQYLLSIL